MPYAGHLLLQLTVGTMHVNGNFLMKISFVRFGFLVETFLLVLMEDVFSSPPPTLSILGARAPPTGPSPLPAQPLLLYRCATLVSPTKVSGSPKNFIKTDNKIQASKSRENPSLVLTLEPIISGTLTFDKKRKFRQ